MKLDITQITLAFKINAFEDLYSASKPDNSFLYAKKIIIVETMNYSRSNFTFFELHIQRVRGCLFSVFTCAKSASGIRLKILLK